MSHELYDLFETVYTPYFSNSEGAARIADRIEVHRFDHRPGLEGVRVALFGVLDGRNSGDNEGCAAAPDAIRERLYRLMPHRGWMPTVDLGNLRPGVTSQDTHAAVRMVVNELVTMGIVPVVLGGGQDLTVPMYEALSVLGEPLNVVTWDARLDFGADPGATTAANYMNDIVLAEPNRLFDYVNIGHQGYLTDADTLELLDKMQFDAKRLGLVHDDVEAMEPILRDADLVSIDMQAVRGADHPAHAEAGPNGLDAQQVCRLGRYAGMSDRLKAIGLFEHNPALDVRHLGAELCGQVVWHILEGIFSQKADYPKCTKDAYQRYVVDLENVRHEVVFYKSPRSDRWWMEVPFPPRKGNDLRRELLISCSYADYQDAAEGNLPDRWWKTFQKLA
jgi:arginase family enzyme